jgi:hypothetical protein
MTLRAKYFHPAIMFFYILQENKVNKDLLQHVVSTTSFERMLDYIIPDILV